jgi:hypothetical protein
MILALYRCFFYILVVMTQKNVVDSLEKEFVRQNIPFKSKKKLSTFA